MNCFGLKLRAKSHPRALIKAFKNLARSWEKYRCEVASKEKTKLCQARLKIHHNHNHNHDINIIHISKLILNH